jgi:phosphate transport system substrate-binding protein
VSAKFLTLAAVAAAALAAPGAEAQAQVRDQMRIVGSSTVYPFSALVVERFAQDTRFKTPALERTGSGAGFAFFCASVGSESPDITNASRRMSRSEFERCADNGVLKITEVKVGFDGIVLANATQGPQAGLTTAQLWQALAARVPVDGELVANPYTRWNEIDPGLPDQKIEVYGPPSTSGTRDAFNELAMETGCAAFEAVRALPEARAARVCVDYRQDGAWVEAGEDDTRIVEALAADSDAFGIFGYSFLDTNRGAIQAARIDGVAPDAETIGDGRYPLSRALWFYVKNAHVGVIPGIEAYVREFTGEPAWGPDGYLADAGLIPLPESERAAQRATARSFTPMEAAGAM